MPGPITALFFSAEPMTGAKGGEQIREMLVVRVVSMSILNKAEKTT